MASFICATCGIAYAPSNEPPPACKICEDERQYVGYEGQQWVEMEQLKASGHRNSIQLEEPGMQSIRTEPRFAIGQRALLIQTSAGNLLWDCVTLLDEATIEVLHRLGGVQAIAISHPHFYAANVAWSEAFGNAPIYLHAEDREWCVDPHPNVIHWSGDWTEPVRGLRLLHLGGHFAGAQVLHWPDGDAGRGVLLSGDTVAVVSDRRWVSFMYSYPNEIPLSEQTIRQIVERLRPYRFNRIYGAFAGRTVFEDGNQAVERSAQRYIDNLRHR